MDGFLEYFEQMPTYYKLGWIIFCLAIFWIVEAGTPLIKLDYKKWRHALVNLSFLAAIILINVLFGIFFLAADQFAQPREFGILFYIDLPIIVELLIAFMVFDLVSQYFAHYLLHKVKPLWKLHIVHHSDTKVDATTGTRNHPLEFVLRETFALIVLTLLGAPIAFYLFYRICTIFFTYFTHANISLPQWLDRSLSYVFITPNMHKFHHHFERPWTDTNFGNIFSFWDRIFGTLVYDETNKIKYGLDVLDDEDDEKIGYLFKLPWNKNVKTDY
ncbi:MAG: sterol desaturase family protein [Chitinophagales bacterium]|nr:sterol desaturase family protein [Chitinophagales bacterium]